FAPVRQSPRPPLQAQTSSSFQETHGPVRLLNGDFSMEYRFSTVSVTVTLSRASWRVPAALGNANLLRHEQGHFDITGLIARDLCGGVMSLNMDEAVLAALPGAGTTPAARLRAATNHLMSEVTTLHSEATRLMNRLQPPNGNGLYDFQTNHGLNAAAQQNWDNFLSHARNTDTSLSLTLRIFGVIP